MLAVVHVQRMSKISFNIRVSENVHVKCFSLENVCFLMRLGLPTNKKVTKSLKRLSKTPLREDFLMDVNCCCVAGQRQRENAKTLLL